MKMKKLSLSLVVILCMAFVLTACNSKEEYEEPVQKLMEAKQDVDVKKFLSLFGPLESMMSSVVTEDVFKKKMKTYQTTCGDDYKLTYQITKKEELDEDALVEAEDNLSMLGEEVKIAEGYKLDVKVTAKGKKDKMEKDMTLTIGKVDNKWCIVNFDKSLLE